MSTYNICFRGEIRKELPDTHSYLDLYIMHNISEYCICLEPWFNLFLLKFIA